MKIKEIPINDRPIERLLQKGASSLSDEELLAILIKTGNRNESSKQLAHNILKKYDNLLEFSKINYEQLTKINGIKKSKASIIEKKAFLYLSLFNVSGKMSSISIEYGNGPVSEYL